MIIRQATLLTRGFITDYRHLSAADSGEWEPQLKRLTDPTRPMVLLKTLEGGSVRLRIAGINSSRRDRVGTRIRFDLSLELTLDDNEDQARLTQLLYSFISEVGDISKSNKDTTLGAMLDRYFDEPFVEACLEAPASDVEVNQRLLSLLMESVWEVEPPRALTRGPRWRWSGGVESEQARELWMRCVWAALAPQSKPRSIYMLNTVVRGGEGEREALKLSQAVLGRGQAPPWQRIHPGALILGGLVLGCAVGAAIYLLTR